MGLSYSALVMDWVLLQTDGQKEKGLTSGRASGWKRLLLQYFTIEFLLAHPSPGRDKLKPEEDIQRQKKTETYAHIATQTDRRTCTRRRVNSDKEVQKRQKDIHIDTFYRRTGVHVHTRTVSRTHTQSHNACLVFLISNRQQRRFWTFFSC